MATYCTWCNREILPGEESPDRDELCLTCTLNFISGQPSERRHGERRRYTAKPAAERRGETERRQS